MSDDLVKRLLAFASPDAELLDDGYRLTKMCHQSHEAADRIEELEAKLAKAVELVEEAYCEGFAEGHAGGWIEGDYSKPWKKSALFATFAELKGEQP